MKPIADALIRRMERDAVTLSKSSGFDYSPALQKGQPRWKVSKRWVEFQCGCIAERFDHFALPVENYDPVIFQDLREDDGTTMQALYYRVCHWHEKGMFETRIKFSHRLGSTAGYADFNDWSRRRRPFLIGAK